MCECLCVWNLLFHEFGTYFDLIRTIPPKQVQSSDVFVHVLRKYHTPFLFVEHPKAQCVFKLSQLSFRGFPSNNVSGFQGFNVQQKRVVFEHVGVTIRNLGLIPRHPGEYLLRLGVWMVYFGGPVIPSPQQVDVEAKTSNSLKVHKRLFEGILNKFPKLFFPLFFLMVFQHQMSQGRSTPVYWGWETSHL